MLSFSRRTTSTARAAARLARRRSTMPAPLPEATVAHALTQPHVHDPWAPPTLGSPLPDNSTDPLGVSRKHWDAAWDMETLREAQRDHVCASWKPTSSLDNLPYFTHGEGIYLHTADGRTLIDWTSQAVCVNLGHTVPPAVHAAVSAQLDSVAHVYSGLGMVEARVRLSSLLSELLPDPLTGLLFPSSGGEANEAAIRIARRYTGRQKILTQYRSYHGGTAGSLTATGDFRRGFAEAGVTGFVKALNPTPLTFAWGDSEEEAVARSLAALEEQILLENPETVAGVLLESIVGSGGTFAAHPDYMRGVRALCDKYGIVYIADEVMVGFGRTGKMWGFQHYEGVVPDVVTSAKGLSGAYLPISMVAMSKDIMEFFREQPVGWGSTYHAHPVAMACAYECVKHMVVHDLVGNAARLESTMAEWTDRLVDNHPSVRQGRALGLFGCLDLAGPDGAYMQPLAGPPHPAVTPFQRALTEEGIFGLVRPPLLHCAPPLVITDAELRDGFERVDRALHTLDAELGF